MLNREEDTGSPDSKMEEGGLTVRAGDSATTWRLVSLPF